MNVKIIDRAVITDESVYPDPRYYGGVFGYIKGTDIDVVTSPIAEYDINKIRQKFALLQSTVQNISLKRLLILSNSY